MTIWKTAQSDSFAVKYSQGPAREAVTFFAIVAMATGMLDNANDEVGLFWVPKGFVVTGIRFDATDMDSGTALVWDVGDDGSEARLLSAITTGQAAGNSVALATGGFLYKYTADTLIKAFINTAAGTPVAGTLKVALHGIIDPEFDTTALVAY